MKAIRVHEFGGPEILRFEDVPDPQPGKGQVVVQVRAVGVNPVEAYIRTGTYAVKPTLPYTPGNDAAGIVESVGEGVTTVKPGDRVYTSGSLSGTYAEQTLCTEAQIHSLPSNVSFEQGAAMGTPYSTAYRAVFQRGGASTVYVATGSTFAARSVSVLRRGRDQIAIAQGVNEGEKVSLKDPELEGSIR